MSAASTDVIEALIAALGADQVRTGEAIPPRNCNDWAGLGPSTPAAVVRPRDTAEVATAVRICAEHDQPLVAQGGMTGVSGAARPGPADIALSLDRLTGIEEIDPATATMTVRAGTSLETVQEAAQEAGFLCPLDLGARGTCMIGGNISTNAGGNRVIRYGMTREMVLGLEVVLADGTVITSLNKMIKNNAGYDLKQLFIGSEGSLGIVTRAVIKLHPLPRTRDAAFIGCSGIDAVVGLLQHARQRLAGSLSAFEVMWPEYYDLMVDKGGIRAPLAGRHGLYVLLETQGTEESESERLAGFLGEMLESDVIEDAAVSQSAGDVTAFWGLRDAVSEFQALLGPRVEFDIGLPTGEIGRWIETVKAELRARWPELVIILYGHLGDGNIHVQLAMPGGEMPDRHDLETAVFDVLQRFGGTVTAEHGLGALKMPYLHYCRSEAEIALMRRIKQALDPKGILNRGKVLPPADATGHA